MDSKYLQQQRFQLQKRFRRMNSCSYIVFHSAMLQLWDYLHSQPLLEGVLAKLKVETPTYAEEIKGLTEQQEVPLFETESKATGFNFRLIEHCCSKPLDGGLGPEVMLGHRLSRETKHDAALDAFREMFLEPFYEYLDEALDGQAAVLAVLLKYKRKVEWFERDTVVALARSDERALAKHLYAYLFDQGLDFHIEPQSASGEADLVAPELVLDAKVFDGGRRGTTYVTHGVNQLHTYAQDFNQTAGYLVIFKTCPEALHFAVPSADDLVPHVKAGGKTLYLMVIDICRHESSASKRGPLKTLSIDEAVLVRAASETPAGDPPFHGEAGAGI